MGCFSRRSFIKGFLSGAILPLLHSMHGKISIPHGRLALIEPRAGVEKDLASEFRGEELRYRIGFLWFKEAAIGRILFEKDKGSRGYKAILDGKTSGFIGWLTRYRRDIYTSYMEVADGGKRFRPLRFEEDVVIGDKIRKKVTRFDYREGKLLKRRRNRRGIFIQSEEKIPEGVVYDDFLTALQFPPGNLREDPAGEAISSEDHPQERSFHDRCGDCDEGGGDAAASGG